MDESDRFEDQRTFRVNFSTDGAAKLREKVRDKLKEFMGDYTDDTLVEYVIVLLRNGRRKEEARNELNVFLGDDSGSFVSWLWGHLSLSLDLYVQSRDSHLDEVAKTESILLVKQVEDGAEQLDSESERKKLTKESKSRRNREWKGLVRDEADPPPLRSSEIENFHSEKQTRKKFSKVNCVKRPRSPRRPVQHTQSWQDERQSLTREVPLHPPVDAPRRLLQFAVRDAVGTLRSPTLRTEPSLKRLRSVVSTSTVDSSLDERPPRIRSIARFPSGFSTALEAAAEAAADVRKDRSCGNVFDRLGHSKIVSEITNQSAKYEYIDPIPKTVHSDYRQDDQYYGEFAGTSSVMLDSDNRLVYDSASDNEGYEDVNGTNKDDNSMMVEYSVADNASQVVRSRVKDQNLIDNVGNTSRKIVNISVNVNTWKPPHYQAPREIREVENLEPILEKKTGEAKATVWLLKEANKIGDVNDNEKSSPDAEKVSQKTLPPGAGSFSAGRPSDDADSRSIFVNNVHFAATKDTLSRHFNKFGEVLKVVMVTDAATGQPKGSAYIEFLRKESAELALSMNGTSFMSRILKVVKKSSAYQEPLTSNNMTWPRVTRASPYAPRLTRPPFPRGIHGAFRARPTIKAGARSLQWKRDSPASPTVEAPISSQSVLSPTTRNLTYVRNTTKPDSVGSA
ncbi:hypothetical protein GIB67_040168 [Kingdonia uniflora]|uniref:RRM domain-containing protein n=1 Tax=Kingdonia uniflora TaxID=39325 RepID=A0A7J7MUZ1_9MAGN|nr:hypothetical protein GIB67_040168 [Kingdonia uniflora]